MSEQAVSRVLFLPAHPRRTGGQWPFL